MAARVAEHGDGGEGRPAHQHAHPAGTGTPTPPLIHRYAHTTAHRAGPTALHQPTCRLCGRGKNRLKEQGPSPLIRPPVSLLCKPEFGATWQMEELMGQQEEALAEGRHMHAQLQQAQHALT